MRAALKSVFHVHIIYQIRPGSEMCYMHHFNQHLLCNVDLKVSFVTCAIRTGFMSIFNRAMEVKECLTDE